MYIFTYAVSDENANELFSEYHLGRRAFRYNVCLEKGLDKRYNLKGTLFTLSTYPSIHKQLTRSF